MLVNLCNTVTILSALPKPLKRNTVLCFSRLRQTILVETGKLGKPMPLGNYKTGQLFIHKLYGYRGIILFPWLTRMHDGDKDKRTYKEDIDQQLPDWGKGNSDEYEGKIETFYNALIDERDCPFIKIPSEDATLRPNLESRDLFSIPALDFVWHQDVMPYSSTSGEEPPLRHGLLNQLMSRQIGKDPPYVAQDTLLAWRVKNRAWLQLTEVHKETTEGVQVTVIPFYLGSRRGQGGLVHWWRFHVSLVNLNQIAVLVSGRHWRVFTEGGILETDKGSGINGQRPLLTHSMPAIQYSSHVGLTFSLGYVWGKFHIQREDGLTFDCRVPQFILHNPAPNNLSQLDQ